MPNYSLFSIDYMEPGTMDGDIWAFPVVGAELNRILNPDEIVIRAHAITIVYDYPLSREVKIAHKQKGGWTRADIARVIREDYERIYRDEDSAVEPAQHESAGPYGIWGHEIGDLVIEAVKYDRESRTVRLGIGS
jgi:hypothetical protein